MEQEYLKRSAVPALRRLLKAESARQAHLKRGRKIYQGFFRPEAQAQQDRLSALTLAYGFLTGKPFASMMPRVNAYNRRVSWGGEPAILGGMRYWVKQFGPKLMLKEFGSYVAASERLKLDKEQMEADLEQWLEEAKAYLEGME
jgi:hypothetical protein